MDATREYAHELIQAGIHRLDPYSEGTSVLNFVSYAVAHDHPTARAAFNEVRETPIYAAYLSSELAGGMSDDGFGNWEGVGVAALAFAAFGQVMASVVQTELDLRRASLTA